MTRNLDIIQTERLVLRGIDETDAEEIVKWRSDRSVYQYFKAPHAISIEEHLQWYRNRYCISENRFDWMCVAQESGKKIGVFGLVRDGENAEINYLLAPEAQHKGYAGEAVKALVKYAADTWKEKRVIAEIHKDNTSSVALVKKLGFCLQSCEGDFVIYGIEV